jgi:hypothetical protein
MKEIVQKHETPPGGWVYKDSRTGITFKDNSIFAIYSQVISSWAANDIDPPNNYKAVIDHEMCEQLSQMECREIGEIERVLTLADIERFGNSIKKWMEGGMNFVPIEEAKRRANICIGCHNNKPVKTCLGCTKALSWMSERVGWPQTDKDSELQGCRACLCLLRLKIHLPLDAIDNTGVKYPDHCWNVEKK